jgi:hypothetical protein
MPSSGRPPFHPRSWPLAVMDIWRLDTRLEFGSAIAPLKKLVHKSLFSLGFKKTGEYGAIYTLIEHYLIARDLGSTARSARLRENRGSLAN